MRVTFHSASWGAAAETYREVGESFGRSAGDVMKSTCDPTLHGAQGHHPLDAAVRAILEQVRDLGDPVTAAIGAELQQEAAKLGQAASAYRRVEQDNIQLAQEAF